MFSNKYAASMRVTRHRYMITAPRKLLEDLSYLTWDRQSNFGVITYRANKWHMDPESSRVKTRLLDIDSRITKI